MLSVVFRTNRKLFNNPPIAGIFLIMVAMHEIEQFGKRMGAEFAAERVILFGSYAEGTGREDSDVDLLVVAGTELAPRERYGAVRRLLADVPASFDILVKTRQEYCRWRSVLNNIVCFADKYGEVLYERENSSSSGFGERISEDIIGKTKVEWHFRG